MEQAIRCIKLKMAPLHGPNTYLPTEVSGTADTWNAEEAQVDTDSESQRLCYVDGESITCLTSHIPSMMRIHGRMPIMVAPSSS